VSASGWVQRVTGRRRPAPLPEPLEIAPRVEDPVPLEPEGSSLYRPPPVVEGMPACTDARVGGCMPAGEERRCVYYGEVAA
jgi:hypothetical protein